MLKRLRVSPNQKTYQMKKTYVLQLGFEKLYVGVATKENGWVGTTPDLVNARMFTSKLEIRQYIYRYPRNPEIYQILTFITQA